MRRFKRAPALSPRLLLVQHPCGCLTDAEGRPLRLVVGDGGPRYWRISLRAEDGAGPCPACRSANERERSAR